MSKNLESTIKVRERIQELEKLLPNSGYSEETKKKFQSELDKLKKLLDLDDSIYQM
jgi:hypothetical protein